MGILRLVQTSIGPDTPDRTPGPIGYLRTRGNRGERQHRDGGSVNSASHQRRQSEGVDIVMSPTGNRVEGSTDRWIYDLDICTERTLCGSLRTRVSQHPLMPVLDRVELGHQLALTIAASVSEMPIPLPAFLGERCCRERTLAKQGGLPDQASPYHRVR
jgi:hypothetical protein